MTKPTEEELRAMLAAILDADDDDEVLAPAMQKALNDARVRLRRPRRDEIEGRV